MGFVGYPGFRLALKGRAGRAAVLAAGHVCQEGAALVLFTDPWLSPLVSSADIVLPASVQASSPFDSVVPALALVAAVVAALVDDLVYDVAE
ncbi:hypothetical protein ACWDKQ_27435 [Saccharopolyspora sp. NPDC000995]